MSYSSRFVKFHRFFSDIAEDILATTVLVPFTLALHCWNAFCDILTEIDFLPERTDSHLWKLGKFIFTLPLYTLKGIFDLALNPLISGLFALQEKIDPMPYKFYGGRFFQIIAASRVVRISFLLIFDVVFSLELSLGGFMLWLISKNPSLSALGYALIQLDDVLWVLSAAPHLYLASQVFMALSYPALLLLTVGASIALLESKLQAFAQKAAKGINILISVVQNNLLRFHINPFKNTIEEASQNSIFEIPRENLFVSQSNHAFDLAQLEQWLAIAGIDGLQNYNAPRIDGRHPNLEYDDILNIERIPNLQGKFPQLANFVKDHKHEYAHIRGKISPNSLDKLDHLADKLIVPQDATRFAEELVVAKEDFEAHLNRISAEEKGLIENLNLLGGNSEEYKLKNVLAMALLPKETPGSWCKEGASRLIKETSHRVRFSGEDGNYSVFWQRPNPTHWMGL